ncbi:MAG: archaeal heat shock protein Hsp20 [Candidatus Norongarragalinales archaeon]
MEAVGVALKKRKSFFDLFNLDLDEEFERIQEEMEKMIERAQKTPGARVQKYGPFVYGFSLRTGPDGKPVFEEFGNVPPVVKGKAKNFGEREPLVDVIEGSREVTVIVELPGVEKNEIRLRATEDSLLVRVDNPNYKYSKNIDLRVKVKPDTAKATYKNGVLEVKLERAKPGKEEEGKPVAIQ